MITIKGQGVCGGVAFGKLYLLKKSANIVKREKTENTENELKRFEKAREEISEQVKPTDWKESDGMEVWDEAFRPVMQKWLSEEVDIQTKIFNQEECADLISSNPDLGGSAIDLIVSGLLHE